jgi:hypothetical protein
MSNRKHSDAKRFGFCTRCLLPTSPERLLIEHHLFGRKNDHTAIVFICTQCNPFVESLAGPIPDESRALQDRTDRAFDPQRQAVLILGDDKAREDRFYVWMIPRAEAIWEEYLQELREQTRPG